MPLVEMACMRVWIGCPHNSKDRSDCILVMYSKKESFNKHCAISFGVCIVSTCVLYLAVVCYIEALIV